eukprot:scaffold51554_cov24-Tisochrysis_lutea.AAC.1
MGLQSQGFGTLGVGRSGQCSSSGWQACIYLLVNKSRHLCRPWQTDTDSRLWTCASQLEEEGVSLIHDSEQAACKYFIHAIFLKTTSGLQCLAHSLDLAALQQGA